MIKLLFLAIILSFFQVANASNEQIKETLKQKLSSPNNLTKSINSAKEKIFICTYCHGIDGNSQKEYIPNLASQNPEYTIAQLLSYSLEKRKSLAMKKVSKELSLEDKTNIAIYYSQTKVKNTYKEETTLTKRGSEIFNTACFICHGKEGRGNKNIPLLAKQKEKYLIDTLSKFKENKNYRPESPMFNIAEKLSLSDIKAVAAYISRM